MGHFRKKMVSVFLNNTCNMSCIYCWVNKKKYDEINKHETIIDIEFAKCGVKDFFDESGSYQLRLFSNGEATLAFGQMKEIVDYAYSIAGEKLFVELQTNGLFDEVVAKWVAENVDFTWISLDGLEDIQKHNRPAADCTIDSFKTVDNNIKFISSHNKRKTKIGLRPTITNYSLERQKELIDYAKLNAIDTIYAYPWVSFLLKKKGQPEMMDFVEKFIEAKRYADGLNVFYSTVFMINFDEEVEINCRALLPAPHLLPDGYVSCCDMMNNKNGVLGDLIYGKYVPEKKKIEYDHDKIKKIRSRNIFNLEACQGCEVLKHCAGGCIGAAISYRRNFMGINPEYCKATKYLFKTFPELVNSGYNPKVPLHP